MAKVKVSADQQRRDDVEATIRSLYSMFPTKSSCHRYHTVESNKLSRAIKEREKALKDAMENDKEIKSLRDKKAVALKTVANRSSEGSAKVEALMRSLRLHGVTDKLVQDIEKVAAMEPVVLVDDDCC